MNYVFPKFLEAYSNTPRGAMSAISSPMFFIILCIIAYYLFKNNKLKIKLKIPGTLLCAIIGIVLVVASLIVFNGIYFHIGLSMAAISSFLYIKRVKAERAGISQPVYYPSYIAIFITYYVILSTVLLFLANILGDIEDYLTIFISILSLIISAPLISLYFLPYLIARKKEHRQTRAIYILTIFTGWTIIAWIIALVWAHTIPTEKTYIHQDIAQSNASEILKYKELYDSGIITEKEYEAKKKQLLDL